MSNYLIRIISVIESERAKNQGYEYGVQSWKNWVDKTNAENPNSKIELLIGGVEENPQWAKYNISFGYFDQVCSVDADTIVHPDCPNFFEIAPNSLRAVLNFGSIEWICRSTEVYGRAFFDRVCYKQPPLGVYVNSGFLVFPKKFEPLLKEFNELATNNLEELAGIAKKYGVGYDQTPLNYFLFNSCRGFPIEYLPWQFNAQDLTRRRFFDYGMPDIAHIYHLNAGVKPLPATRMKELYDRFWRPER